MATDCDENDHETRLRDCELCLVEIKTVEAQQAEILDRLDLALFGKPPEHFGLAGALKDLREDVRGVERVQRWLVPIVLALTIAGAVYWLRP